MTHRVSISIAACSAAALTWAAAPASNVTRVLDPIVLPFPALSPESDHLYATPTRPDRIGRVMAPVKINGQGPFRMTVDTGANQSVITTRVAQLLGLQANERHVKLTGVTGSLIVPTVAIELFETGSLIQRNIDLPMMPSVMGGADGILGMEGFEDKRITVDFANDRFQIADSRGQRSSSAFVRVPVKVRFKRLLLATGRVDGVKVHAVIDTGAQRTLGNNALRAELLRRRRLHGAPSATSVIGMTDVVQEGDAIYTRRISLGDLIISDVDVIYGDIHVFRLWGLEEEPALLVGMDILGTLHTLIVDYRLKELQIRIK